MVLLKKMNRGIRASGRRGHLLGKKIIRKRLNRKIGPDQRPVISDTRPVVVMFICLHGLTSQAISTSIRRDLQRRGIKWIRTRFGAIADDEQLWSQYKTEPKVKRMFSGVDLIIPVTPQPQYPLLQKTMPPNSKLGPQISILDLNTNKLLKMIKKKYRVAGGITNHA